MNVKQIGQEVGLAVLTSFFTHSFSVSLGNGTLTASVNGQPVTLTVNSILASAFMAYAGQKASVQVGSVLVTFTPNASATEEKTEMVNNMKTTIANPTTTVIYKTSSL